MCSVRGGDVQIRDRDSELLVVLHQLRVCCGQFGLLLLRRIFEHGQRVMRSMFGLRVCSDVYGFAGHDAGRI